ncbi:SAM-dependent DNA methyltransferase [Ursidibacter sp. B-7004-1]
MQVKSKQRVADFGEVYTNEREVNAMLDLVKDQVIDPDKTFLEPACGTGNFLVAILTRKLNAVAKKYRKIQLDYERNAILSVSSLYGIELLPDNVQECRKRLFDTFSALYQSQYPKSYKTKCLNSVNYLLEKNILCGDALSLKTDKGDSIIFTEWSLICNEFKRRDYIYQDLVYNLSDLPLFSDEGEPAFIPQAIKDDYPLVHFLELNNE